MEISLPPEGYDRILSSLVMVVAKRGPALHDGCETGEAGKADFWSEIGLEIKRESMSFFSVYKKREETSIY